MRRQSYEIPENPQLTEGILYYLSADLALEEDADEELNARREHLQNVFNEKYLIDPDRLIDEINIFGEHLEGGHIENLKYFLESGQAFSYERLADVTTRKPATSYQDVEALVVSLNHSRQDTSGAKGGEDGRYHRIALFQIAKHYKKTVEDWFSNNWESASVNGKTPIESIYLTNNLFFAAWYTLDPKNAEIAEILLSRKLDNRQATAFSGTLLKISKKAYITVQELDRMTENDWRKNGKAKKQYRQMYGKQPPKKLTFYERCLWDTEFRETILTEYEHLIDEENLILMLSFYEHFENLVGHNNQYREILEIPVNTTMSAEISHALRAISSGEPNNLWRLITSHKFIQMGAPPSQPKLLDDLDHKLSKDDPEYRHSKYQKIRMAYHKALGAIHPNGNLRAEGVTNNQENRVSITTDFLAHTLFGECMRNTPADFWERAKGVKEMDHTISTYGQNMISVQGDIYEVASNPYLQDYLLESITLWEASDLYPDMDGFVAKLKVEGIKEPFTLALDENLKLYYLIDGDLTPITMIKQLEDLYRELILEHVEAIKVSIDDDETLRIPGSRGRIKEVNREKYGPHFSRIPTRANRVPIKWENLEEEARELQTHYRGRLPDDIRSAVEAEIAVLEETHGPEVSALYDSEYIDPLLLHFALGKKFKYVTWRSMEQRSMSAGNPRKVMIKKGNNHDFLSKQDPMKVTMMRREIN